jgi:hypothetical protein
MITQWYILLAYLYRTPLTLVLVLLAQFQLALPRYTDYATNTDLFAIPKKSIIPTHKNNDSKPEHWITVFVHGIKSIKPHVSLDNFFRFMNDDVEDTVYAKTVELMRTDAHFFQNQPMQAIGLHKVDKTSSAQPGNASHAMAVLFDEISRLSGSTDINHYYTYGWSGLLSPSTRYKEAVPLLLELEKEVEKYRALDINPKIRFIGYSHGGNVCLNVAKAYEELFPNCTLTVNQLIMVGSPVQGETDYLIHSPLFEHVYHFYSSGDRIQKLDFFSFDRFFSGQTFAERKDLALPRKLTQVQIKVMRNTSRTNACTRKQQLARNMNNPAVITGNTHLIRDASPGHSELWFFGWTPLSYRKTYPLHPFPTIAFAPLIIKQIQDAKHELPCPEPIVVDIRPDNGLMMIRRTSSTRPLKTCALFTPHDINNLKSLIQPFTPIDYTAQKYDDHIRLAYEHARVYHAKHNASRNPLALKNQKELQKMRHERRKKMDEKRTKKNKLTMNVPLHQELNCPFCHKTHRIIALLYRMESQSANNSSIESCCARKLSVVSDILWS